jgi:hypothetical protein
VSQYSTVLNGQLIAVAPSTGVMPAPAPAPLISQGSSPSTLPGAPTGGALATAATAPTTAGGSTGTPTTGGNTISGLVADVWKLPPMQNPLFLTLLFLVVAYVILRAVHWSG